VRSQHRTRIAEKVTLSSVIEMDGSMQVEQIASYTPTFWSASVI
jgi:hypothetical protein